MNSDLSLLVRSANPVPTVDHLGDEEFSAALAAIEISLAEHPKWAVPFLRRLRMRPVAVFAAAMTIVVLMVAIPLLLIHSFVQGRANNLITNLDEIAADLFAKGRVEEAADAG